NGYVDYEAIKRIINLLESLDDNREIKSTDDINRHVDIIFVYDDIIDDDDYDENIKNIRMTTRDAMESLIDNDDIEWKLGILGTSVLAPHLD
ncbi:MAG: hypothetical protein OXB84_08650, partial [Halobacteriovoraceae bacterium]|nr:hypothetical protein [Halobacteriovoraceae bacterium]